MTKQNEYGISRSENLYNINFWRLSNVDGRARGLDDIGLADNSLSRVRDEIGKRYRSNEIRQGVYANYRRYFLVNGCLIEFVTGGPGVSHITSQSVIEIKSEFKRKLEGLLKELNLPRKQKARGSSRD